MRRGYTLARLVREAGATPGLQRLRLSSIEVNHVSDELVRALRETPTVSRHLHVPLQSGDDRVLSAMGRRYTAATYLRRLEPLARLQPDGRRDRRLPDRGRAGVRADAPCARCGGCDEGACLPVLAAARDGDCRRGSRAGSGEEAPRAPSLRADSHEACLERWRSKLGATDEVLVDRPGRGYGDDYSPWLVDGSAPVGELVPVRAVAVTEEGIVGAV